MIQFEELLARAHTGDEEARETLILENRPLVYAVAKRFEPLAEEIGRASCRERV